jgi:Dyp-type peroxidase family
MDRIEFDQVQANILLPFPQANCGRIVCLRFDPAQRGAAKQWLRGLLEKTAFHDQVRDSKGRVIERNQDGDPNVGPWYNVGFTHAGLEALGYDPFILKYTAEEFAEGMQGRAERLGDLADVDEVAIHAVVMIHAFDGRVQEHAERVGDDVHNWRPVSTNDVKDLEYVVDLALADALAKLELNNADGVRHVVELDQDTYSLVPKGIGEIEYFGFRDGVSQPRVVPGPDSEPDSPVSTVLLGYPRLEKPPEQCTRQELVAEHLRHGSFLVIRKLSQDVEGFRNDLEQRASAIPDMDGRQLAEMMMGRRMDGAALLETDEAGDFDFKSDPHGRACPFQSHVRRVNPRTEELVVRRIMRRAMPYSSYRYKEPDQGLMFQAYNANIEGQFEFVQRLWVNSGVENHGMSRDRDPIAGEPVADGNPEKGKGTFSFTAPESQCPHTLTNLEAHVRYRWGDYFLVPSRQTLAEICDQRDDAIELFRAQVAGKSVERARDVLGRWLDDPPMSKRIWESVRKAPTGVVRIDEVESVLVGTVEQMETVLYDDGSRYSVRSQGEAMRQTTGAFYLGMDASKEDYKQDSRASAAIIPGWRDDSEDSRTSETALNEVNISTLELCFGFLGAAVTEAVADHDKPGVPRHIELDLEKFAAFVLSGLTPKIFGVPQPSATGTFSLNIPSSGYIFFPYPEELFLEYAEKAGSGISAYLSTLFDERERAKNGSIFDVSQDPLHAKAGQGQAPDESWKLKLDETLSALEDVYRVGGEGCSREDAVRLLAGIISGMLITSFKTFTDGISEYTREYEVGEPIKVSGDVRRLPFDSLRVRHRSMPNVIYRVNVGGDHTLADVAVKDGDFVLTCQGSAMADRPDEEWFYGDRSPADDEEVRAPHFCPGYKMADRLIGEMSFFVMSGERGITNLRRLDDSGTKFACDWAPAYEAVEAAKAFAAAAKSGSG